MHTAAVQVDFSAAHFHQGAGKECEQVHGHNYRVEVAVRAEELRNGMVIDFRELRDRARRVVGGWDHRLLNDLADFQNVLPTTENIARLIYGKLSGAFPAGPAVLAEVRVWEKENCWASYRE